MSPKPDKRAAAPSCCHRELGGLRGPWVVTTVLALSCAAEADTTENTRKEENEKHTQDKLHLNGSVEQAGPLD